MKYSIKEFSADWELTNEEYENNFKTLLEINQGLADEIKEELIQALQDPEWSWVKIGYDTNFIGSDDSEENVWLTVKYLIWDIIAPDEEPPANRFV
ncbi:hypothetical protein [Tenacibaculum sp. C7A-26P2]|uniref:hypothetical protein n=1 Tax=Tenacibaculum sp. C7A-26P2 TaxID=3447504 RepID=UPI003F865779